jgi:hypothetical protein
VTLWSCLHLGTEVVELIASERKVRIREMDGRPDFAILAFNDSLSAYRGQHYVES